MSMGNELPDAVRRFLTAMDARNDAAVGTCFTDDATYHLIMPMPPVTGRAAITATFAKVIGETSRIRWEVVSHAVVGDRVYLERVDRFWYGDREAASECLGVFVLKDGLIHSVRDYADFETWRGRKEQALQG
jgi:limonene-1,2-epoxide hydrolase